MKDWFKKIIAKIKEWLCATPAPCLWYGILGMFLTAIPAIPLRDKIGDMWPAVPVIALEVVVMFFKAFFKKKVNLWYCLSYFIGLTLIQILYWL